MADPDRDEFDFSELERLLTRYPGKDVVVHVMQICIHTQIITNI